MMRVLCLLILPLLLQPARAGDVTPSRPPVALTLDTAIRIALESNRDMSIADQDRYKADAQVSEARSGALPQLNIVGQYTRNIKLPVLFIPPNTPINPSSSTMAFELGSTNAYVMSAQLSQTLFSRKVGTALEIASTYRDFTEQGYHAAEQSVSLQVKRAYYSALLAQKLVEVNRQGFDVVKANVENIQSLFKHGNAAEFDLLRAEVQVANTEPLVISADNTLVLAKNALKNLLAMPLDQEITLQDDFVFQELSKQEMDQGQREAVTNNPSILQLSLQESLLEKNISIERSNYFPTLSLVGSYQWQSQDNTFRFKDYLWANSLNVGLTFSWPLFDGLRTSARTEQASVDRQRVHFLRLKAEEGLAIQIQSAALKMDEARRRIRGQERNIEQAQRAVQIAQTRFKSGVGTQLELLDTQVAMTRAQTTHAQAIYDFLIARADWQYAVGQSR